MYAHVSRLWNLKISSDNLYNARRCRITKEPVLRKKRMGKLLYDYFFTFL